MNNPNWGYGPNPQYYPQPIYHPPRNNSGMVVLLIFVLMLMAGLVFVLNTIKTTGTTGFEDGKLFSSESTVPTDQAITQTVSTDQDNKSFACVFLDETVSDTEACLLYDQIGDENIVNVAVDGQERRVVAVPLVMSDNSDASLIPIMYSDEVCQRLVQNIDAMTQTLTDQIKRSFDETTSSRYVVTSSPVVRCN